MKYNKLRGAVAMLLALVMVAAMLPVTVYAADTDGGGSAAPSAYDIEEDATPDNTGEGDYAEGGEVEVTVRELYGSPENAPLFATQAAIKSR